MQNGRLSVVVQRPPLESSQLGRAAFSNMPGVPMSDLVPQLRSTLPPVLANAGGQAGRRVIELFTAEIRNENTREAYGRAVRRFFDWASTRGLTLEAIEPVHVAAYVEQDDRSAATVKQHLSAIRRLFDWLVTGQVITDNPAAPVRPHKLVVESGKTPVLTAGETRELIDSVVEDASDVAQLRDRAIIGVMVYTFARVSAVARLDVMHYFQAGHRWMLHLQEKGRKRRDIPVHHKVGEYLDAYLASAGLHEDRDSPLFQSLKGRTGQLAGRRLQSDCRLPH
jgi:site-specific recombinase XerD